MKFMCNRHRDMAHRDMIGLLPSKTVVFICFIESPVKVMENAFYFLLTTNWLDSSQQAG